VALRQLRRQCNLDHRQIEKRNRHWEYLKNHLRTHRPVKRRGMGVPIQSIVISILMNKNTTLLPIVCRDPFSRTLRVEVLMIPGPMENQNGTGKPKRGGSGFPRSFRLVCGRPRLSGSRAPKSFMRLIHFSSLNGQVCLMQRDSAASGARPEGERRLAFATPSFAAKPCRRPGGRAAAIRAAPTASREERRSFQHGTKFPRRTVSGTVFALY
jgi:hypothetical protein